MRPIATDRVAWSVCRSVCNNCELCKNGRTDRDAIWDVDLGGPKELCTRWAQIPHRNGHFWRGWCQDFPSCCRASLPMALTLGFPCMLLTSIAVGQPQKPPNVTLNFPSDKSTTMWSLSKILWPLVTIYCKYHLRTTLQIWHCLVQQSVNYGQWLCAAHKWILLAHEAMWKMHINWPTDYYSIR